MFMRVVQRPDGMYSIRRIGIFGYEYYDLDVDCCGWFMNRNAKFCRSPDLEYVKGIYLSLKGGDKVIKV